MARMPFRGKRRRKRGDPSYGQGTYTRNDVTYGRRLSRKSVNYARLFTHAAGQRNVWGFAKYTKFGDANGAYYLENWKKTTGTQLYHAPVHLWDVTAIPNNVNGTFRYAQVGVKCCFDSALTPGTFAPLTLGPTQTPVNVGHTGTSTANTANASSFYRGFAAKLLFYAPQTIPTRITVKLIQITRDKYHPGKQADGTFPDVGIWQAEGNGVPASTDPSVVALWSQIVTPYSVNPVTFADAQLVRKYVKVVKQETFILNPRESSDNTATTYHQLNFYHRFARRANYSWQDQDIERMTMTGTTDSDVPINAAVNKCSVEPKARYYLMIAGTSVFNEGELMDAAGAPSYDISMRFYHDDCGS